MSLDLKFLKSLRDNLLDLSARVLKELGDSGNDLKQGNKNEIVTKADDAVENEVIDYLRRHKIKANLDGEERRRSKITANPDMLVVLDPVDGTYRFWRNFLPYSTVVTIFDSPEPRTLGEGAVTGIIDHTTRRIWRTSRNEPVFLYEPRLGREVEVKASGAVHLNGDVSGFVDHGPCSKPEDLARFHQLYEKSWVTNISSAGVHLASVASGNYAGSDYYVCGIQKPEELVSGLMLVENAGGIVADFQGKLIKNKPYDFDARYEVIAASTSDLAKEIRANISGK